MRNKRYLRFLLSVFLFCSFVLSACDTEDAPTQPTTTTAETTTVTTEDTETTAATQAEELSLYDLMTIGATVYNVKGNSTGKTPLETEQTDFGTVSYGTVLTHVSLDAIGIANSQMSAQELRELCLRYFKLQQSFLWTPDADVKCYPTGSANLYENYMRLYAGQEDYVFDRNTGKAMEQGTIYGGIPYQNVSTGNLYRWLEYYDESTGEMSLLDAFVENGNYDNGAWMGK